MLHYPFNPSNEDRYYNKDGSTTLGSGNRIVAIYPYQSPSGESELFLGQNNGRLEVCKYNDASDTPERAYVPLQNMRITKTRGHLTLIERVNSCENLPGPVVGMTFMSPNSVRLIVVDNEQLGQRRAYQACLGEGKRAYFNLTDITDDGSVNIIASALDSQRRVRSYMERVNDDGTCTIECSHGERIRGLIDFDSVPELRKLKLDFVPDNYKVTPKGTLLIEGTKEGQKVTMGWDPLTSSLFSVNHSSASTFEVPLNHRGKTELVLIHDDNGMRIRGSRLSEDLRPCTMILPVRSEPLTSQAIVSAAHLGEGYISIVEDKDGKQHVRTFNVWGLVEKMQYAEKQLTAPVVPEL